MADKVVRLIGGPLDGMTVPWVRGYFREGDEEYIDGLDKRTGLPIAPACYRMRGGNLYFVEEVSAADNTYGLQEGRS